MENANFTLFRRTFEHFRVQMSVANLEKKRIKNLNKRVKEDIELIFGKMFVEEFDLLL